MVKLDLPMGKSYLYSSFDTMSQSLEEVRSIAHEANAIFLKVESMTEDRATARSFLRAGFRKSNKSLQPQRTVVVEVTQGDEALFAAMHPKTRYNIRLAQKKGVVVAKSENKTGSLSDFWKLLAQTAQRDDFTTHPLHYYEELLKLDEVELYSAFGGDNLLSAAIVIFYEGRATYLHGASSHEHRSLMAPHLMHWQIIRDARARGMREYDFWGIDEARWPGVTRFKRGFGGREVEYIGSYDYPLQKFWHRLYVLKNEIFN